MRLAAPLGGNRAACTASTGSTTATTFRFRTYQSLSALEACFCSHAILKDLDPLLGAAIGEAKATSAGRAALVCDLIAPDLERRGRSIMQVDQSFD
jgi:hypothetical protein